MTGLPKGWAKAALAELGHWKGGGTPSKARPDFWGGPIPWVSPKDMKTETITSSIDGITALAIANSSTSLVEADSVLIVTRSGILAHTFPVAVNKVDVTINQDMRALTPHDGIDARFVLHALKADEREILRRCVKDGTTVHSVELSRLMDRAISLPPLPEQHRIVAKIEELFSELDAGEESLTRARAQLGLYRQSLLKGIRCNGGMFKKTWDLR